MHYGPFSFGKNSSLATITTNIPEFNDIIGQRLDFSASDIERLSHMYNCTRSLTLLDQCDFETADLCGLVQETGDEAVWIRKINNPMGQDNTQRQQCKDAGHVMYFNTSCGKQGDAAILESRILDPKRKQQCLQFFLKMTGSSQDRLAIWVKIDDGTGNVRRLVKIKTFQGDSDHNWKIAHVNLKCQKKFRFLFHGLKGNPDASAGGIYIDDLTLSETQCPRGVWLIRNFSQLLTTAPEGYSMHSPRFYSPEGYGYSLTLSPRGLRDSAFENYIRISFHLVSGENDAVLEWPALRRQVTITVLDQNPNVRKRMSSERSFTTDEKQVFRDLTHLRKTEHLLPQMWPIGEKNPLGWKKKSAHLKDWQPYPREHCDQNPCQNEGVCTIIKGNTSCRCATNKIFFYTGVRCQVAHVNWSILCLLIGGAAGTIILIIVSVSIIAKAFFQSVASR
ncbi:meprin A subunit alpha-like isoform X2 [Sceloporus undulatus]|uniref:meprin A subunit alpha-like isoform X2 n=1 Tax=Sceloporus undulatus TaxID=8520 RepID=UPI001C4A97D3|nr:meprin A subunit alpha-like isoform X2 [Sceloporus undulatus]